MFRAFAAALIGIGSFPVSAKCVEEPYQVSGRITSASGQPVAGADIGVAWRDNVGGGIKRVVSAGDGSYVAAFRSSTLSGDSPLRGDICEARVTSAAIEVAAKGYRVLSSVVKLEDGMARADYNLEADR